MKIVIDARTYFLRSGVGRYTKGLVDSMIATFPEDTFTVLISNKKTEADFPHQNDNVEIVVSKATLNDYLAEQKYLPEETGQSSADVALFPFFILPDNIKIPAVTTILDLTFLRYSQYHASENIEYLKRYLDRSLGKAEKVSTISQYVKDDIMRYAGDKNIDLRGEDVSVIYPGVSDIFFEEPEKGKIADTLAKYRLEHGSYLLYVGSIEPRKNIPRLLEAFDKIETNKKLVLAGILRWLPEEYENTLRGLKNRENFLPLGFVPDEELASLYRASAGVVYPSLSEGFGLPVAEGYVSGRAVFTSDNSSMKEIGTAAFLTDPEDVNKMSHDLEIFARDDKLRAELVNKSRPLAENYRWNRFAAELRELLVSAINKKKLQFE